MQDKTCSIIGCVSNHPRHYDLIITIAAMWLVSTMLLKNVRFIRLINRIDQSRLSFFSYATLLLTGHYFSSTIELVLTYSISKKFLFFHCLFNLSKNNNVRKEKIFFSFALEGQILVLS
jgi:hypothetical protein